jgi:hypothetical protein
MLAAAVVETVLLLVELGGMAAVELDRQIQEVQLQELPIQAAVAVAGLMEEAVQQEQMEEAVL